MNLIKLPQVKLLFVVLALLINCSISFAQSDMKPGLGFEVMGTYKKGIKKDDLSTAKTLADLKEGFPTSWIGSYKSVFVSAIKDGSLTVLESNDEVLTSEQIHMIQNTEYWSDVTVNVTYYPKSNMLLTDEKEINFTLTVLPENDATYPGGYDMMRSYLKSNTVDKISKAERESLKATKVKFTIDETGKITYAEISERSENDKIDKLLINAIYKMPKWTPATASNGTTLKQDFVFMIGNEIGC